MNMRFAMQMRIFELVPSPQVGCEGCALTDNYDLCVKSNAVCLLNGARMIVKEVKGATPNEEAG